MKRRRDVTAGSEPWPLPQRVVGGHPYACCMSFTALHRVLGRGPGPLTDELLDSAVAAGATESDDLDWKSELPPQKGLPQTDFPKRRCGHG